MNTFTTFASLIIGSNVKRYTLNITKIDPINSNSVLLYFTNLSNPPAGSTYEYSFDGISFSGFSPSQTESPLNISNLTNNTNYTFYIRVVGTETISNDMPINFVGLTPTSFTSNKIISYASSGLPPPTTSGNYRCISATDYGNILIATDVGIYYSNNYGDTFTKSTNAPTNCTSVSINNKGYALCCNGTLFTGAKLLYFSYNFGITWTKITNATITKPSAVFMSQNGTSYVYNYPVDAVSTSNRIYRSNDYFSTTDTSQTVAGNSHRIRLLNFASNGNGVTTGNNLPGYYFNNNLTTTTAMTTRGLYNNAYAVGISENGRYLSAGTQNTTLNPAQNLSANFYDFETQTTSPYSSLPNFTIKHILNNGTNGAAFVNVAPIGNNGICYILLDGVNRATSTTAILYKYDFSGNIFTNLNIPTLVGNYNSLVNTSPSGNYAVVCSYSTDIYILAPNPQ